MSISLHTYAETGIPCHETSENGSLSTTSYAPPLNYFTPTPSRSVSVYCETDGVGEVVVGTEGSNTTYVYEYGYHKIGNVWRKIRFSGEKMQGSWSIGTAKAPLEDMRTEGKGSVLAYVCEYVQGVWKCGCRDSVCATTSWQLQQYDVEMLNVPTPNTQASTISASPNLGNSGVSAEVLAKYMEEFKKSQEMREVFDVYTSPQKHVDPGGIMAITGYDFSKDTFGNTVYLNNTSIAKEKSPDGRSLTFTIPKGTNPGFYEVRVARGSKKTPNAIFVWVRDSAAPIPVITSITPAIGTPKDTFTIHGGGFMPTGNMVVTTYGSMKNLPSTDGKTIIFTMEDSTFSQNEYEGDQTFNMPMYVHVAHAGGVSTVSTQNVVQLRI